jgi:bifunctional DNA-binding transcriptional regulator/antitoxin component of YhaV-PrlF toxin-antitoxin module
MGPTLTITAKGQITLRKEVLQHLGVEPGEKVVVDFVPTGRAELRAAKSPASIDAFIGCLAGRGSRPLSTEEIVEIAATGAEMRLSSAE